MRGDRFIYFILFSKFRYSRNGSVSKLLTFIALILAISLPAYADAETEASKRGRHIFSQGEKSSTEMITANVGAASIPIPATALPCAGCHGRDGKGRAEGGVRPSNITWSNLTKEYGGTTSIGRRYKA